MLVVAVEVYGIVGASSLYRSANLLKPRFDLVLNCVLMRILILLNIYSLLSAADSSLSKLCCSFAAICLSSSSSR